MNFYYTYPNNQLTISSMYYPFGSIMPNSAQNLGAGEHTYGFNGKMDDKEMYSANGTSYDYGFRIYNPRLGKFLSVDPLTTSYPWYTPYQFAGNQPIWAVDLDGLEPLTVVDKYGKLTKPAIYLLNALTGVPKEYLGAASVTINQDFHDKVTGYKNGAITLGTHVVYTLSYKDATAVKFLDLSAHEVVHIEQFFRDYDGKISEYLKGYVLESIGTALQELSTDPNILHDKIPMEQEANSRGTNNHQTGVFDKFLKYNGNRQNVQDIFESNATDNEKINQLQGLVQEYQNSVHTKAPDFKLEPMRKDNIPDASKFAPAAINAVKSLFKAAPAAREVYHSVRFL